MFRLLLILFVVFPASLLAAPAEQAKVLIVPKGMNFTFWQVVESGVKSANSELKQSIIWRGPYRDNDLNSQIAIVRNYLNTDIQILAIAPIDAHMLTPFILQYQRRGKQVLVFDSQAVGANPAGFIATDNYQAGVSLVKAIAPQLSDQVHVLIVQNDAGHASTEDRVSGFRDQLKQHNVSSISYIDAGSTKGSSLHATYDALSSNPDINLILTVNEATTEGAALAVRKLQRGHVLLAGFDLNDSIYRHLNEGIVQQLVVQDPYALGYQVMQQAGKLLAGQPIEANKVIPFRLIGKTSLADPQVNTFLRQFLGDR